MFITQVSATVTKGKPVIATTEFTLERQKEKFATRQLGKLSNSKYASFLNIQKRTAFPFKADKNDHAYPVFGEKVVSNVNFKP